MSPNIPSKSVKSVTNYYSSFFISALVSMISPRMGHNVLTYPLNDFLNYYYYFYFKLYLKPKHENHVFSLYAICNVIFICNFIFMFLKIKNNVLS